jgi:hypothetical protein
MPHPGNALDVTVAFVPRAASSKPHPIVTATESPTTPTLSGPGEVVVVATVVGGKVEDVDDVDDEDVDDEDEVVREVADVDADVGCDEPPEHADATTATRATRNVVPALRRAVVGTAGAY